MSITIRTAPKNRISINSKQGADIQKIAIAKGVTSLSQLRDVDTTDADNNETLVYDELTGKYVTKTLPIVDGGNF